MLEEIWKSENTFLWDEENVLNLDCGDVCRTPWTHQENIELYTLNGWVLWYVNYISILEKNVIALGPCSPSPEGVWLLQYYMVDY